MHLFSIGAAVPPALGLLGIGLLYLFAPRTAGTTFGLALLEGPAFLRWLRVKGVRDVVAGSVLLGALEGCDPRTLATIVILEAMIPLSDMVLVLAAGGRARAAAIHGVLAALTVAGAAPLLLGHA